VALMAGRHLSDKLADLSTLPYMRVLPRHQKKVCNTWRCASSQNFLRSLSIPPQLRRPLQSTQQLFMYQQGTCHR
jgi:hypothetical protein